MMPKQASKQVEVGQPHLRFLSVVLHVIRTSILATKSSTTTVG